MATKTQVKKASEGKVNALQKPLQLSEELAAVIGSGPLPRGQVVSKFGLRVSGSRKIGRRIAYSKHKVEPRKRGNSCAPPPLRFGVAVPPAG